MKGSQYGLTRPASGAPIETLNAEPEVTPVTPQKVTCDDCHLPKPRADLAASNGSTGVCRECMFKRFERAAERVTPSAAKGRARNKGKNYGNGRIG